MKFLSRNHKINQVVETINFSGAKYLYTKLKRVIRAKVFSVSLAMWLSVRLRTTLKLMNYDIRNVG